MPKADPWPIRVLTWPSRVLGSSLPLRVIATTLVASLVILALGAWMILVQALHGIVQGKQDSAVAEAKTALNRMQSSFTDTNLTAATLSERLTQLVDQAAATSAQYKIVIDAPFIQAMSAGVSASSVPVALKDAMAGSDNSDSMWVTPTLVKYTDDSSPDTPGIAVGGNLHIPSGEAYPVYFIFALAQEETTLAILRGAVWSTMAFLSVSLAGIAYLVARQIGKPVRQASDVARRIAAGDFDQRLRVVGTDDLASLAVSMNDMASTLSAQIAQLEELSRLQRRFVSDVSHELRTPLTTVRMASDLLYEMRSGVTPTLTRTVELMHTEVDRFEALLADLLEISRFDAGAATLSLDDIDFSAVVSEGVADVRALAERSGVPLVSDVQPNLMVEADTRRIRRILRNLLFNAIEHSEGRPVEITVAGDEHAVAVTVRDHGVGFLPEQAQLVFHRFWRADPSRQRSLGGTGLGLAIALEDARLHSGWLQAWGEPGQGALFRLTLPRSPGDPVRMSSLPLRPADLGTGSGQDAYNLDDIVDENVNLGLKDEDVVSHG
ncbi:MAG: MtrAB system histidine kinase MtrB [Propionibacteriaceae bacterium]|nr:MtrAB system histidine kinase MtrB [Propionibacteriaceae bacterium]